MSPPTRIALLGFKPQERAALEAFLRLAPKREPAYAQVSRPEKAQLWLVDTDAEGDEAVLAAHALLARADDASGSLRIVAVGSRALPGAVLHWPRPLNVLRLFSRIDRLRVSADGVEAEREGVVPPSPPERAGAAAARPAPEVAPDPRSAPVPVAVTAQVPAPTPTPERQRDREPERERERDREPEREREAAATVAGAAATATVAAATATIAAAAVTAPAAFAGPTPTPCPAPPLLQPAAEAASPPPGPPRDEVPEPPARPLSGRAKRRPAMEPPGRADAAVMQAPTAPPGPPLMPAHERITLVGLGDAEAIDLQDLPPHRAAAPAGAPRPRLPPRPTAARVEHVLVVDAGEEVFRFLVAEIGPFGFSVHRARDAAEALDRVNARGFRFAFLHAGNGQEGAARLALQLRLAAADRGREPPAVVMVGAPQALVGMASASSLGLAEIDAFLTLPLQRDELLDLVGGRTLQRQGFAPTSPQSTYA
ncbi:MAG: hypothetical protein JNJ89_19345 [Rubrivivax sp.]|nr:hypothetical protein [Rubrivivax sp.]